MVNGEARVTGGWSIDARKRTAVIVLLLTLMAISAFATQNAVVTMRLEPNHFLIGLGGTMVSLTVTNVGLEPVQLSGKVRIRAVAPDGTSSVLQRSGGEGLTPDQYPFAERDDPRLRIPTLGSETFYLRTGVTGSESGIYLPWFFYEHHFDIPGKYLLRAELLTRDPSVSFLSDQVSLKIEEPQGRDAAVLALIRAAAQNVTAKTDENIARDIMTRYADSGYAPYWVGRYLTTDETLREALYFDAIQRTPEGYATELKLALLSDYQTLMGQGINYFDLPTALAYREKARAMAQDLSKSRLPYAASEANSVLTDTLPTPDQLRLQFNAEVQRFSVSTGLVVPFAQCVDRGIGKDDPMITLFGFDSPNSLGKYIATGAANRLRPDDATAELPTYFRPGHNPRPGNPYPVVAVTKPDVAPSWTLDGGVASVSTATPACPPQQTARPVAPLFDCLSEKGNDDNLTASFGYTNPNAIPVRISYGPTNSIVGAGTSPTVFLPGEHHGVFTIKGKKDTTPAWTLQGQTVAASAGAIQCSSDHGS
jgi:hypothetical protein